MIESTQKVSDQDGETTTTILCEDSLDISSASSLHELLNDAIESGHQVSIDLTAVTKIDTSCIQLLLAFSNEAKKRHLNIDFSQDNHVLIDALRLIGLDGILVDSESTTSAI